MLSTFGRVAAGIVVAGGAILLRPQPAQAAEEPYCSAMEESLVCSATASYSYFDGNLHWCAHYAGGCTSNEEGVSWNITFHSQEDPCPDQDPC
jgi:hypothetical protein